MLISQFSQTSFLWLKKTLQTFTYYYYLYIFPELNFRLFLTHFPSAPIDAVNGRKKKKMHSCNSVIRVHILWKQGCRELVQFMESDTKLNITFMIQMSVNIVTMVENTSYIPN